jgi:hypothetical protein
MEGVDNVMELSFAEIHWALNAKCREPEVAGRDSGLIQINMNV